MIKINQRIVSVSLSVLCALIVGGAFQVQAQEPPLIHLSDQDKFAIVESVLLNEFMVPREEFRGLVVSSENLEFIQPSEMSRLGFRLIRAGSQVLGPHDPEMALAFLRSTSTTSSSFETEYLVFRKIEASGNNAMVTLSRVFESHPCFGPQTSREEIFIYQYHIESGRWTGELIGKTPKRLGDSTRWSRATGAVFRLKDTP